MILIPIDPSEYEILRTLPCIDSAANFLFASSPRERTLAPSSPKQLPFKLRVKSDSLLRSPDANSEHSARPIRLYCKPK